MVAHMKTTIEIADSLLAAAKAAAAQENRTLRDLVEQGLRSLLALRRDDTTAFRLRDVSVDGKGLRPGVAPGQWDHILDMSYEGRGG